MKIEITNNTMVTTVDNATTLTMKNNIVDTGDTLIRFNTPDSYQVECKCKHDKIHMLQVCVISSDGCARRFSGITEVHWNSCPDSDHRLVSIESSYFAEGVNIDIYSVLNIVIDFVPWDEEYGFDGYHRELLTW